MNYNELLNKLQELKKDFTLRKVLFYHDVIVNNNFDIIIRERRNINKCDFEFGKEYPIIKTIPIEQFSKQITEDASETALILENIDPTQIVADRFGFQIKSEKTYRNLKGAEQEIAKEEVFREEQIKRENFYHKFKVEIEEERLKQLVIIKDTVKKQTLQTRDFILNELIICVNTKNEYKKALYSFGIKDDDLSKYGMQ